jgi:hypothetical protein
MRIFIVLTLSVCVAACAGAIHLPLRPPADSLIAALDVGLDPHQWRD